MIILGFMLLIIGLLVIPTSYALYAYATIDVIQSELFDATLTAWIIIPGILLVIFLILAITSIVMMQRGSKWQPIYIISMVMYFATIVIYYINIPEPLKDLIVFTNFCFIVATICLFIGHAKVKKQLAKEGKTNIN